MTRTRVSVTTSWQCHKENTKRRKTKKKNLSYKIS